MKFYIEIGRTVGVTGDLTAKQANKFYEWAREKGTFSFLVNGLEGQVLIVLSVRGLHTVSDFLYGRPTTENEFEKEAEYGCWEKDDAKLWENIKRLHVFFEKYHYVTVVKIYPESVVPNSIRGKKQIRFKDLEDGEKKESAIAEYLRAAKSIRGPSKNKTKDVPAKKVYVVNMPTKENIADAHFVGTYRAMTRFKKPENELPMDKIHRLHHEGMKWKEIGKIIYLDENGEYIHEKKLEQYVDNLRKQYKKAFPDSYKIKK